jgi:hypothetical protein
LSCDVYCALSDSVSAAALIETLRMLAHKEHVTVRERTNCDVLFLSVTMVLLLLEEDVVALLCFVLLCFGGGGDAAPALLQRV